MKYKLTRINKIYQNYLLTLISIVNKKISETKFT